MSRSRKDADPTSTLIGTAPSRLRRTGPFVGAALAGSLALSACTGEAAQEEPEITNVSVLGVELPDDLAKIRQAVLELCKTGEGADEMNTIWEEAGYHEASGMSYVEALTFDADFGYVNPEAVINYGSYTYPTTLAVAENCQEASLIISQGVQLVATKDALAAIEEFRASTKPHINREIVTAIFETSKSAPDTIGADN